MAWVAAMTRRRLTIFLHWTSLVLLVLLLAGAPHPPAGLSWAFALCGLAMTALALVFGLLNDPGPKLEGALRRAHPWLNRAMYAALAWAAIATVAANLGTSLPGPPLPTLYFILLSASALHGVFHLWRHTALGDGALRRVTPRAVHGIL